MGSVFSRFAGFFVSCAKLLLCAGVLGPASVHGSGACLPDGVSIDQGIQRVLSQESLFNRLRVVIEKLPQSERPLIVARVSGAFCLLKDADQAENGVFLHGGDGAVFRLDLTLADVMDQVSLGLEKHPELAAQLAAAAGDKPIENFPLWLQKFVELREKKEAVRDISDHLIFQLYDQKGVAIPIDPSFKNGISRIMRLQRTSVYNSYLSDPEGEAFSRHFARVKRSPFLSTRLTVAKIQSLKRKLPKQRKRFFAQYLDLLKEQEKKDAETFEFATRHIRIIDRSDAEDEDVVRIRVERVSFKEAGPTAAELFPAKDPITGKERSISRRSVEQYQTVQRRKTEGWFNAIQSRSDKREILEYLRTGLRLMDPPIEIPVGETNGETYALLTPSFLHAYRNEIEPLLKAYNYQKLILDGDDEHLSRMTHWLKENSEEVAKRAGLTFKGKRRHVREDILEHYETLVEVFPGRPWEPKHVLHDKRNQPVLLVGQSLKTLYKIGAKIRELGRAENVAALAAGAAVLTLTDNPVASAASASAVRNVIQGVKKRKKLQDILIPTIIEGSMYLIPAAGFVQGELARAVMVGGVKGFGQSALSGQNLIAGTLVGAGLEVAELALPTEAADFAAEETGAKAAIVNAAIEKAQSGIKGASHGALTQTVAHDGRMSIAEAAKRHAKISIGAGAATVHDEAHKTSQYRRMHRRWGNYSAIYLLDMTGGPAEATPDEQSQCQQAMKLDTARFFMEYLVRALQDRR